MVFDKGTIDALACSSREPSSNTGAPEGCVEAHAARLSTAGEVRQGQAPAAGSRGVASRTQWASRSGSRGSSCLEGEPSASEAVLLAAGASHCQSHPASATLGPFPETAQSSLLLEVHCSDNSMTGGVSLAAMVAASVHAKLVKKGSWIIVSGKQPSELLPVLGSTHSVQSRYAEDGSLCRNAVEVETGLSGVSCVHERCLFNVIMLVRVDGTTIVELQKVQ